MARKKGRPELPQAVPDARPDPVRVGHRPVATPTKDVAPLEVEWAMDQSNVRSLVRTLMEAAATENPGLRQTMVSAIGRYGSNAKPIILDELGRAQAPVIRKALEEALAHAK